MNETVSRRNTRRVAIIGGGLSGLAAAYELCRMRDAGGPAFALFEASPRLGGIVETVRKDGFVVECGPDSWVTEKPWARELAEELGLDEQGDEIVGSNDRWRRTYLVQHGKLAALPAGMRMMVPTAWEPLLSSPLFSWAAKLAYLREPKRADELKRTALALQGDDADEPVADFVRRHFGDEVTGTVAGPLLAGVFGGDVAELSVRAVMAPFVRMEAEHGSLIAALASRGNKPSQPVFTTLASGLGTLIDRIVASLPRDAIRLNAPVHSLSHDGQYWTVTTASESDQFDTVLLATSLDATRALIESTRLQAAQAAADLLPKEASSAVVAALGFTPPASSRMRVPRGFGFLVPPANAGGGRRTRDDDALLACTFMEQKFPGRAPAGSVLLRGFFGGVAAEQLMPRSDAEIAETAHRQLSRILGVLPPPQLMVVRRWPRSLPQYTVGHLARLRVLADHVRQLPGLSLIGNAYYGVGLPDLVRDARAAVRQQFGSAHG